MSFGGFVSNRKVSPVTGWTKPSTAACRAWRARPALYSRLHSVLCGMLLITKPPLPSGPKGGVSLVKTGGVSPHYYD